MTNKKPIVKSVTQRKLLEAIECYLQAEKKLASIPNFIKEPIRPVYCKEGEWNNYIEERQKFKNSYADFELQTGRARRLLESSKEVLFETISSNVWIVTDCSKYAVAWIYCVASYESDGAKHSGYKKLMIKKNPKVEKLPNLNHPSFF